MCGFSNPLGRRAFLWWQEQLNLQAVLLPDTEMNMYYFWTEISNFVGDEGKWDVCLTLILELWAADFSAENASKRRVLIYPAYFYIIKWATELQSSFGIIADVSIIILFSLKSVMVCVSGSQLHCWIDAAHCQKRGSSFLAFGCYCWKSFTRYMFVNSQLIVGQLFFSSIRSNLFCQHTVKYFSTHVQLTTACSWDYCYSKD